MFFHDYGIPLSVVKEILGKLLELVSIENRAFIDYIRGPMIENMISPDIQRKEVLNCIENENALMTILHLQLLKLPTENFLKLDALKKKIPQD